MRALATKLLGMLRASASAGTRTIELLVIWKCYSEAGGYQGSGGDPRADLAGLLIELEEAEELRLPSERSRRQWDVRSGSKLPAWIILSEEPQATLVAPIDHRSHPWPVELSFMRSLRNPRRSLLDGALRIQAWLAQPGSRQRPIVPVKERSLELFGHEKRLEPLLSGELFRAGRLTPAILRCAVVPEPLTWEIGPESAHGRTVLIIENLSTYLSFCDWNRTRGEYAAVAYGRGKLLQHLLPLLPPVLDRAGSSRVDYFGDLDAPGLAIPIDAQHMVESRHLLPCPILPAERWYAATIERNRCVSMVQPDIGPWSDRFGEWFSPPLAEAIRKIFGQGRRLPQELVGLEYLRTVGK